MAAHAKFSVGAKVNHPAAADGSHPAGTGTVESVSGDAKAGFTYKVKCDATGAVLPTAFAEADLTAAKK